MNVVVRKWIRRLAAHPSSHGNKHRQGDHDSSRLGTSPTPQPISSSKGKKSTVPKRRRIDSSHQIKAKIPAAPTHLPVSSPEPGGGRARQTQIKESRLHSQKEIQAFHREQVKGLVRNDKGDDDFGNAIGKPRDRDVAIQPYVSILMAYFTAARPGSLFNSSKPPTMAASCHGKTSRSFQNTPLEDRMAFPPDLMYASHSESEPSRQADHGKANRLVGPCKSRIALGRAADQLCELLCRYWIRAVHEKQSLDFDLGLVLLAHAIRRGVLRDIQDIPDIEAPQKQVLVYKRKAMDLPVFTQASEFGEISLLSGNRAKVESASDRRRSNKRPSSHQTSVGPKQPNLVR